MQFDKALFEQLEAERKALETRLFQTQVALDALRALCTHEWESAGFLVDQYEQPICKHCGIYQNEIREKA